MVFEDDDEDDDIETEEELEIKRKNQELMDRLKAIDEQFQANSKIEVAASDHIRAEKLKEKEQNEKYENFENHYQKLFQTMGVLFSAAEHEEEQQKEQE